MEKKIIPHDDKFIVKFHNGYGDSIGSKTCDTKEEADAYELELPKTVETPVETPTDEISVTASAEGKSPEVMVSIKRTNKKTK